MGNHSCILLLVSSHDLLYLYSTTWPFLTQFWVSNVPTWSILCRSSGFLEEVLGVITSRFGVAFVGFQRGGRDILELSCGWALWTNPRGLVVVEQRPGISDQLVHKTKNSFHFVSVWFLMLDSLIISFVFYWFARPGWKRRPWWYHGWTDIIFVSDVGWFRFLKWFWRTESDL
jgi:hypothetical protein